MRRADGWVRQGLGVAAVLMLIGLALWLAGFGVAQVWYAAFGRPQ